MLRLTMCGLCTDAALKLCSLRPQRNILPDTAMLLGYYHQQIAGILSHGVMQEMQDLNQAAEHMYYVLLALGQLVNWHADAAPVQPEWLQEHDAALQDLPFW